jgi:hypothetical protein
MENIYLLPTEKASRIRLGNNGNFVIANFEQSSIRSKNDSYTNQHIYIISDEEIKEGDWCINLNSTYEHKELCRIDSQIELERYAQKIGNDCKKIILTTDQDLIAGGVQAIDDEFLEWFVKNPSCEFVDVKKQYITPLGDVVDFCYDNERLNYKIIIPQEELNPFELPKALPDDVFYQSLEAKQETLEDDAKYQAERMYSEEDLREAFRQGENNVGYNSKYGYIFKLTEKEWFEQFSKLKNG